MATTRSTSSTLTAPVVNLDGSATGQRSLDKTVFGLASNAALVSEVLVSAQANRRHAIAHTLHRGEVSGGGRKPWRQKGTGRARAGSTRSPLWRHGGVGFGPTSSRNFHRKINRKAQAAVVQMLLSDLATSKAVTVVDGLAADVFTTTKQAATFLNATAGSASRPLVLMATTNAPLLRSFRNLPKVMVRSLERLSVLDLGLTDSLLLTDEVLTALTARYDSQKMDDGRSKMVLVATTPLSIIHRPAKRSTRRSKAKSDSGAAHD